MKRIKSQTGLTAIYSELAKFQNIVFRAQKLWFFESNRPHQKSSPLTLLTKIIQSRNPQSCLFEQAKRDELEGLINEGTFKLVLRTKTGPNLNIISFQFVLANKQKDGSPVIYKTRYVVGRYEDRDTAQIVHDATTIKHLSLDLLLALASMLWFDIQSIFIAYHL